MIRSHAICKAATSLWLVVPLGLLVSAAGAVEAPRASVQAVRVAAMPKIDGTLDDPLWGKSPVLVLGAPDSQQPDRAKTTTARVLFAPGHICVAVRCLDPETDALYQLYSLFVDDERREAMAATYRRGRFGYGEVKKQLADVAIEFFAQARQRRGELEAHPDQVRQVLADGAAKARNKAAEVLLRAQRACGVKP